VGEQIKKRRRKRFTTEITEATEKRTTRAGLKDQRYIYEGSDFGVKRRGPSELERMRRGAEAEIR